MRNLYEHIRRRARGLRDGMTVALALVGPIAGCATDPIARWKNAAERQVIEHGGGDLGALRLASRDGDRFDDIGPRAGTLEMFPANRDDVYGVLLPVWRAGGVIWQPMLIGVVRFSGALDRFPLGRSRVEDIRLVAARVDGAELEWKSSAADAGAVNQYVAQAAPGAPTTFPTEGDRLEVEDVPGGLIVHERRSGATWMLLLSESET